ncbi:hypothetical protein [Companilactobacillus mishanensis]|uniref:Surface layer protein A domain-containing protein n=1 Tax=Companilactobacillus mishanensis TaxID=2486008 RepID=A0A5P0ZJZ6_9LACO|nr:hypothetical protein [Companilactobacillus mishanensis]MQS53413.1 hypothetical protein [Companilactobacillus mishanensis]
MKKTKYAGIAVAVLLALTPVTTTTTNAASLNVESIKTTQAVGASLPDLSKIIDAFNTVKGIFDKVGDVIGQITGNKDTSKPDTSKDKTPEQKATDLINGLKDYPFTDNFPNFSEFIAHYNEPVDWNTIKDSKAINGGFNPDAMNTMAAATNLKYKLAGAAGQEKGDFVKTVNYAEKNGNGAQVTFSVQVIDTSKNNQVLTTKYVTFTNNTKKTIAATDLNIKFDSPINVKVGESTLDPQLSASGAKNTVVTDKNGNNINFAADPGDYYSNDKDALKNDEFSSVNVGNKFALKDATFYQPVTLTFAADALNVQDIFYQMIDNGSHSVTVNGKNATQNMLHPENNSITFVRQIKVNDPNEKPTTKPDTNTPNPDTNNPNPDPDYTIGVWKETDQPGYVITNSTVSRLTNDETSDSTRALAPNTNWATDKLRVNTKTGVKQYRVSTHEWVNASDVTFRNSTPGLTNFTSIAGGYATVKLAGPDGFVYDLFSKNGDRVQRGLAGNSNWATDMTATDKDGKTYYRVSTDEWVPDGAGVTVK